MIWVDREVKKIKLRHLPKEWVDDMKTPSGRIHVGSLRGVVIHDLLYKVLLENGVKANFSYVFNDMDPMDAIPTYLDQKKYQDYAGFPLFKIPSPTAGYENFAKYFALEFAETFAKLNCHPKIIWSSELYLSGKMDGVIKKILDKAGKVREIYNKVAKAKKKADWHPFQVICEKCGRLGTTYVYKWDGKSVYYRCQPNMVAWAKGCSHTGKISPFSGRGKLVWKLDWPAHWSVIGVTIECSGKDHMSAGGSYDLGKAICREIIGYPAPYAFGYEWFTVGGKKMSSSKGVGTSAKEVSGILPPDVFRFLLVRNSINTHIDFNPYGQTILNLFDDYDRCLNAYFAKLEGKVPQGKRGEIMLDFARIVQLSQVRQLPKERIFLPRFRIVVNLLKNRRNILAFFNADKLAKEEREILNERIEYAKIYLEKYTQEIDQRSKVRSQDFKLTVRQKEFLERLAEKLKSDVKDREEVRRLIFDSIKESGLETKEAFRIFYLTVLGKDFGPKAADLILELGAKEIIKKIKS